MYEIYYLYCNDWGKLQYVKRLGFKKKLSTAIKIAMKLGTNSYVKKYGDPRPLWINGKLNEVINHGTN